MPHARRGTILVVLLLLALAVLVAAPLVGIEPIPLKAFWNTSDTNLHADILWQIRVPRVAMGFLAGAALALAGMTFQSMFRNPLAEPFTLGVSSGAALGAAVAIHYRWHWHVAMLSTTTVCAFTGAMLVIGLIYGLTRARRGFSTATMLLAGVAVSFFCSSLILLVQYFSDFTQTFLMLRWVMGGLDSVVSYHELAGLAPLVATGVLVIFYFTHELNLLSIGEELAASRGVELTRTKLGLFLASSLMVGGVVAVCGPIGFVGLMAPHICRLLIGMDHRWLMPASLLFGGAFLVVCDTLARTVMAPTELPVGIVTSLLGGPFFLWLLLGRGPARTGF